MEEAAVNFTRVKITTTIPPEDAPKLREALGKAGAGKIGDYTFCSFSILGEGRSKPNEQADPHIGKANELAVIKEEQVEVTCSRSEAKTVIAALRATHPYEEPIVEITPLLSEDDL
jgi:hypothetical protein